MMQRPGLDAAIIKAIQAVDDLIKTMREGVAYPSAAESEDTAVKRYLMYLSILVDLVLPDIVMSAIAGHDHMVEMKQRILLEYSAKAAYFDDHPDYALFMMTVDEAKGVLRKLTEGKSDPDAIANAERNLEDMKNRFPPPAGMKRRDFSEILADFAERDDYVWLYKAPSALLHGDPEGMHIVLEQKPDGTQVPHLTIPMDQLNAMLVDTGRNALLFCDRFIDRFHAGDETMIEKVREVHRTILRLTLKHQLGRSPEAIAAVTKELADLERLAT